MSHGDLHFRWDASRDGRRRRVLMDEHAGDDAAPARRTPSLSPPPADGKSSARTGAAPRYAKDALAERQARITDLVPTRPWTLLVLLLLALTGVAGIAALFGEWGTLAARAGREGLAALDVTSSGSLATWFSSMLLMAAAVGSVLVYTIRRHREDDYRGRYRVWLWSAAVLLVASIDATARLHLLAHHAIAKLTGASFLADAAIWPLVGMVIVYGVLGVRMLFEIRSSRGATVSLSFAGALYVAAAAVSIVWPERSSGHMAAMAFASLAMLGHVCVWYTVMVYARNVYLDAQGALPAARRKRQSSRKASKVTRGETVAQAANGTAESAPRRTSLATPSLPARENVSTPEAGTSDSNDEKRAKRSWFARLLGGSDTSGEAKEKKPRKERPSKAKRLAASQAKRDAKRDAKLAAQQAKIAARKAKAASEQKPSSSDSGHSSSPRAPAAKPSALSTTARSSSRSHPAPDNAPDDAPRGGFARLWRKQDEADEPAAIRKTAAAQSAPRDIDDDEGDESAVGPDGRKLSKSERRRLRKLQRRAARRAA